MKKKHFYTGTLLVILLLVGIRPIPAQVQAPVDEPILYEEELPMLPEEPQIPGRIEGTGTYFEVTDSEYLLTFA